MYAIVNLLQLISIIYILIYDFKKQSVAVFLWATLLIMFSLPHFFSFLSSSVIYSRIVLGKASLFVLLFNVFYLITRMIIDNTSYANEKRKLSSVQLEGSSLDRKVYNILFYLLLLYFAYTMSEMMQTMGSIRNFSWGTILKQNQNRDITDVLITNLLDIFYTIGSASFLYSIIKKNHFRIFVSLIIIILLPLLTGNRIRILPGVVSFVIYFFFYLEKKISLRMILTGIVFAIMIIFIVYFLRLTRVHGGMYSMFINNSIGDLISQTIEMIFSGDGELSLRNAFYHFIQYDNNFERFNRGDTYVRLLLILIPTSLLGGLKPADFAIKMGSAWTLNPYNSLYSMHPTLYGDVFANFWWFGVLFSIIVAILISILDKKIRKSDLLESSVLMVISSAAFVIVARGSVYNSIHAAVIGAIGFKLIKSISLIRFK